MVKGKLPSRSGSSLEAVEPYPWKGTIHFFFNIKNCQTPNTKLPFERIILHLWIRKKAKQYSQYKIISAEEVIWKVSCCMENIGRNAHEKENGETLNLASGCVC